MECHFPAEVSAFFGVSQMKAVSYEVVSLCRETKSGGPPPGADLARPSLG